VECDGKHINFTLWDTAGQEGIIFAFRATDLNWLNVDV
jgi:hypothetical protein